MGCGDKKPQEAGKIVEKEVTFKGAGGLELPGTLVIPAKTPAPFVVLYPGSGPTDRNGNQSGLEINLLKEIAAHLAEQGIGSLRYDKRVTPGFKDQWGLPNAESPATQPPTSEQLAYFEEFISWENHKADALAAFDYMKSLPESDDAHCGIIGHSEGGLQAAEVAPQANPSALVLLASPGRPLKDVLYQQVDELMDKQGADAAMQEKMNAANKRIMESIIKDGKVPGDVPPGLAPLYQPTTAKFLQAILPLDPRKSLREYQGPVLIVNGNKDSQIHVEQDAKPLHEAAKERSGREASLLVIGDASHNFKQLKDENDQGFMGPVMPEMLTQLSEWLKSNL